jgi:hypothetical protein
MIRRSLRVGMWAGLLAGVAVALIKFVQTRRGSLDAPAPGWPSTSKPWTPPVPDVVKESEAIVQEAAARQAVEVLEELHAVEEVMEEIQEIEEREAAAAEVVAEGLIEAELKEELASAPAPSAAGPVSKASTAARGKAAKRAAETAPPGGAWVVPSDDRCPPSHPVKAKQGSRLFHLPGMFAYDRTKPDRCYESESAAATDGFTKAKR